MKKWAHRALAMVATVVAAAAVLAGGAYADEGATAPDAFERAVAQALDTRPVTPGALQAAYTSALVHGVELGPDDRAGARGPGVLSPGSPSLPVASGEQFAWDAALYGAGAMLAVVMVGAVTTLAIRQRRRVVLS